MLGGLEQCETVGFGTRGTALEVWSCHRKWLSGVSEPRVGDLPSKNGNQSWVPTAWYLFTMKHIQNIMHSSFSSSLLHFEISYVSELATATFLGAMQPQCDFQIRSPLPLPWNYSFKVGTSAFCASIWPVCLSMWVLARSPSACRHFDPEKDTVVWIQLHNVIITQMSYWSCCGFMLGPFARIIQEGSQYQKCTLVWRKMDWQGVVSQGEFVKNWIGRWKGL